MKLVFSGTFNPFTNGHKDLVDRAMTLASELHIVVGFNQDKIIDLKQLNHLRKALINKLWQV